jgi:RHS repeat-associated protein
MLSICSRVSIRNISDYSPFGVGLDGRTMSSDSYRYGFQAQEGDDEVKGEGNSVNFKYRMHDPRLGRFFAVDPLAFEFPHNSPYAFSENRVIDAFELEGLESVSFNNTWHNYDGKNNAFVKTALTWVETAHQGHITAERVQNWKESWYVTVENKRDYWHKSTGTEINFYNNRQDWVDNKPFKTVTERDVSQTLYAASAGCEMDNGPLAGGSLYMKVEASNKGVGVGFSAEAVETSSEGTLKGSTSAYSTTSVSTSGNGPEISAEAGVDLNMTKGYSNSNTSVEGEVTYSFGGIFNIGYYKNSDGGSGIRFSVGVSSSGTKTPIKGKVSVTEKY